MKFQNLSKPAADDRILGRHLNVAFLENIADVPLLGSL